MSRNLRDLPALFRAINNDCEILGELKANKLIFRRKKNDIFRANLWTDFTLTGF